VTHAAGSAATLALTSLARLAADTGGRYTERTNDLTLGFARAQRDLTCVYSIGFYDEAPVDKARGVTIRVRRPGLRAIHPSSYLFRSPAEKKRSMIRAAWISPEMFQTGVMRAHLFPVRPKSKKAWEGLLTVNFPVPLGEADGGEVARDFGAVLARPLSSGGLDVRYKFDRRITLRPKGPGVSSTPTVTFVQKVELEPGRYELTAVLAEPDVPSPHATRIDLEVPEIPRKELFIVDPILGRRSGPNLVVRGGGPSARHDEIGAESSFEPLVVQQLERPDDLLVLTQACVAGLKKAPSKGKSPTLSRRVTRPDGSLVGTLDAEQVLLDGEDGVFCQSLVDVLPATAMRGGDYVFTAEMSADKKNSAAPGRVQFSVEEPAAGPSQSFPSGE